MAITVSDYIDIRGKALELGCRCPETLALLPINFDTASSVSELLQASEAATVKKLFVAEGISIEYILDRDQRPPYVKNKSFDWVVPILFFSCLYSQNPTLVSLALNVLANYATEFFRGEGMGGGGSEVSLNIVVEKKNRAYKKVNYKGPVDGIKDLASVIREISND
jgi:hypothetical protein